MATNVVGWLRDYLTARDLDTEVASGLVVERSQQGHANPRQVSDRNAAVAQSGKSMVQPSVEPTVEHLSGKPLVLDRLPKPLPPSVWRAAMLSLVIFGSAFAAGAVYVFGGALAVVVMPLVMGREGVGTAMITLFTVCVTFVISGILLLAARSAARVIRRERRGVRALYGFAVFTVVALLLAGAMTQWLSVAFFEADNMERAGFDWTIPLRLAQAIGALLFVWVAVVVRGYDRKALNNTGEPQA